MGPLMIAVINWKFHWYIYTYRAVLHTRVYTRKEKLSNNISLIVQTRLDQRSAVISPVYNISIDHPTVDN